MIQGGLCVCVCVYVVLSLGVLCVAFDHPVGGPRDLQLRTALPSLRATFQMASSLVEDGRDSLGLHPVDPAYGRRTVGISWGDHQEYSSRAASPVSRADAVGC